MRNEIERIKEEIKKLKRGKGRQIATLKVGNQEFSIRATYHSLVRMIERNVDEYVVSGTILSLGNDRLMKYRSNNREVMIINKTKNVSVVFAIVKNRIIVITVLDNSDVYVIDETSIEVLK